jgi:uncharacterized protein (DUF2237 family)
VWYLAIVRSTYSTVTNIEQILVLSYPDGSSDGFFTSSHEDLVSYATRCHHLRTTNIVRTTTMMQSSILALMLLVTANAFTINHSLRSNPLIGGSRLNVAGGDDADETSVNVLGTKLLPCCTDVRNTGIGTGFYRNGYCSTGEQDMGRHTICVRVTEDFLQFSQSAGNDLSTPFPQYLFPGLQEGDIWCLCAQRWVEAYEAGKAPQVFLQATHEKTLDYAPFELLREYAIDKDAADQALDNLNEQRDKLNKLL